MKRLFAILLLAAMMLVTACGQPAELLPFVTGDGEIDLKGVEINWQWIGGTRTTPTYTYGTPQYDALLDRINDIEEEFGCTLGARLPTDGLDIDLGEDKTIYDHLPDAPGDFETLELQLMAGTYKYDLVFQNGTSERFKAGYYVPMTDLTDYIDWTDSEKYGSRNLLEAAMYDGVPYQVYPMNWPGFDGVEMCVAAYNKDLYRQYQLTDPHEFYENGTWTYETFENELLAKVDIGKAPEGQPQIYAFQTDEPDFYQCLIASNNVHFVEKKDDGTLVADPYPTSFVNAITWAQGIIGEYEDIILYDSDTYAVEEYCRGEVFMGWLPSNAVTTGAIAYNDKAVFETGIMPLPAGPDAVYGEWGQLIQEIMGFCIPISSVNQEAAAMIISELCEPLPNFEDKSTFYDMVFADPIDIEIYMELGKHVKYDYTKDDNSKGRTIGENFGEIATSPNRSLSEAMEQYRGMFTTFIEEWMVPNYNTVNSVD
ncbi:MAG: hypothetical protein E7481_09575 [Ruminococcaceae bacterium]|nr:hypothetical protein [Oscillospiraceae bacterium]